MSFEQMFIPGLLIIAGILNWYYAISFLRSPEFAKKYISRSPKAALFRKLFGVNKSIRITRKILAPVGILLGAALIFLGIIILRGNL